jgi:hypothetical protein
MRRVTLCHVVEAPKEVERGRERGRHEAPAPDGCAEWFIQEWEMLDSEWGGLVCFTIVLVLVCMIRG